MFRLDTYDRGHRRHRLSGGKLVIDRRGRKIRVETTGSGYSLWIYTPTGRWLYNRARRLAYRTRSRTSPMPLYLALIENPVGPRFRLVARTVKTGNLILEFVLRGNGTRIGLQLRPSDYAPTEVVSRTTNFIRTITLTKLSPNCSLSAKDFSFLPPPGVRVL